MESASEKAMATFHEYLRWIMGIHSGGTIACLSMIGAIVARSPDGKFPAELYIALLVFLLGLTLCATAMLLRGVLTMAKDARDQLRQSSVSPDHSRMERLNRWSARAYVKLETPAGIAFILLIVAASIDLGAGLILGAEFLGTRIK